MCHFLYFNVTFKPIFLGKHFTKVSAGTWHNTLIKLQVHVAITTIVELGFSLNYLQLN